MIVRIRSVHGFAGLLPRLDRSGPWPRRTWLWWTWDHLPPRIGARLAAVLAEVAALDMTFNQIAAGVSPEDGSPEAGSATRSPGGPTLPGRRRA